jgi:hypothetical protein
VKFLLLLVFTFLGALISLGIQRAMAWPAWTYFAVAAVLGLICYVLSATLTGRFIESRAPGVAMIDRLHPGANAWESTAGNGIVPRWVSAVGLLGFGFFLAIPFELAARLFR